MSENVTISPVVNIQQLSVVELLSKPNVYPRKRDEAKVEKYADLQKSGVVLPPVVQFFDGTESHRASGDHRLPAALKAGFATYAVETRKGTKRDATLFAMEDNASHGVALTDQDTLNAAHTLLSDPTWCLMSNNDIARISGASAARVASIRESLSSKNPELAAPVRNVNRKNCKPYQQKVGNIGKKKTSKKQPTAKTEKASSVSEPVAALALPIPDPIIPSEPVDSVVEPVRQKATDNDFAPAMVEQVTNASENPVESTPPTSPKSPTPNWFGKATETLLGKLKSFDGSEAIIIIPGKKMKLDLDLIRETCAENGATVLATPAAAMDWKMQNVSEKDRKAAYLETGDVIE